MHFVNQLLVKAKISTLALEENKFNQGFLNSSFNIVLLDCNSRLTCFLPLQGKLDFFFHVSTLYSFYNYQYSNNYGVSFGKYFKGYYFSFLYPQKQIKQLSLQTHTLFLIVCHLTLLFPGEGIGEQCQSVFFMPTTIQVCSFWTLGSPLQFMAQREASTALSSLDNDLTIKPI